MNRVKFIPKAQAPGNLFHAPVILGLEHGITYADSADDAFALLPAISGATKDASVRGSPAVLRSVLGYNAASRAAQGGQASFMDATKFLVGNMLRSFVKKLEIEMFYGQAGYGTLAGNVSNTNSLTVTTAEWAPGIWAGSEKMPIEIRTTAGVLVAQTSVQSVNMETRVVTLSSNITATAGDVIWHGGAYGKEFMGIYKILTQSGSLFGIDNSQYNLFKGNTYSAGSGQISFAKLNKALTRPVEKGLEGKVSAYVNPRGWSDMLNDQAALRKYDGSYSKKKLENGTEALVFYSQNGEIEIVPSLYVKEGHAFILCMDEWMRVGSSDVTFERPGADGRFFRDLDNSAGYELRCYTDQAIFTNSPGKNCIVTNIVNAA